ncbi:MAG: cytochrome P450 [Actinomycetota bacterium]|uniref:Cytochrome P450 n=1 Tax=Mycobacterium lentiflavum TaxID=141349 RepID=A0ABY3V6F1_MYCLN|nr:cytochrome P450 [Mycobacterium lentiflavum]MEE3066455.1 cytochrome P450 [Actinomycetota bacterium]ULP45072.1 cytochrome P450 [Mycobacterium lentiflavum]
MNMAIKDRIHWAAGYGVSRAALKLVARRGDAVAQLVIDNHRHANMYQLIEEIRQRGRLTAFPGAGLITADVEIVREVLRDNRFRTIKPADQAPSRVARWVLAKTNPKVLNAIQPPSMLVTDPPEHARLRRLVSRAFTPRALEALRDRVQQIVNDLLDGLAGAIECDLVAAYASRVPVEVIAEMLGIPTAETAQLDEVGQDSTRLLSSAAPGWRDFQASINTAREFEHYLAMHVDRLRQRGDDESILAAVLQDGDLTEYEVRLFAALLLGAGFITTTHVMGKAIVTLLQHPDQLDRLRTNPEGWPNAVEEMLRYETAVQWGVRVATEALDLDGYPVAAGQAILLLLGGANRDPAVFERPGEFDITRANAREHVSFGSGIHVCLGATLARMELHIGLQSLFARFPDLVLAGEPTWNDSMALHGLKHLPVRLRPTAAMAS